MTKNTHYGKAELIAAEGTMLATATRAGNDGRVMLEFFPQHAGNAPGMMLRVMMTWQQATQFSIALKKTAENIRAGIDVVPGTAAAPVLLYFPPYGMRGPGFRLVLTAEDAERMMGTVIEAAEFATKPAPRVLAPLR